VVGIDEKTGLLVDFSEAACRVIGSGGVTLISTGDQPAPIRSQESTAGRRKANSRNYRSGESFPLYEFGEVNFPEPDEGLPEEVWQQAVDSREERPSNHSMQGAVHADPARLMALEQRAAAWRLANADALRQFLPWAGR
jgi:hypothetical protein